MQNGLKFSLQGEYRPLTISPRNARKCWEAEFQFALRNIAGDTYPQAVYELEGRDPHVEFAKVNQLGMELLKRSMPFDRRKPSRSEVRRVQDQIEQIHAMANNGSIPADRREFFKNFQLPNPLYMPECWRTTGFLRKRLYIIWGLAKGQKQSTFLPATENSKDWDDSQDRVSVGEVIGGSGNSRYSRGSLGSIFRWLIRILAVTALLLLIRSYSRGCTPGGPMPIPSQRTGSDKGGKTSDVNEGNEQPPNKDRGIVHDVTNTPDAPTPIPGQGEGNDKGGKTSDVNEGNEPPPNKDRGIVHDVIKAQSYLFKVNEPKEISGSNSETAHVEFSVSSVDALHGQDYEVTDWKINNEIKKKGAADIFVPEGGLRYDKTYTITATVTMNGKPQRVEPYQWNTIDSPTWQILEVDSGTNNWRRYKLVCCNSSVIKPVVKDWEVAFRTGVKNEKADFEVEQRSLDKNIFELDWGIGRYKGAYFLEITASIQYVFHEVTNSTTHIEVFPFSHDSSADSLTKAKYEVVIPNVYFCLARLQDGSLINGTAFAISEKLLLSNYHVAVGGIPECYANSGDYKVVGPVELTNMKGRIFYAKVERHDRGRDLAILRLCESNGEDSDKKLPGYLHLAENTLVGGINEKAPRHVFAIGYPKGTVCMGPPAFTDGKAEKVFGRNYVYNDRRESYDTILNYTSTKCGYSGGPLVDYQTESVLGVNFGGLVELKEGHKAASLATSAIEVRKVFPNLK